MTKKIEDGGPAFARSAAEHSQGGHYEQDGMSLRDWFAGQALAGLCGNAIPGSHHKPEVVVASAWALADLMITARKAGEA